MAEKVKKEKKWTLRKSQDIEEIEEKQKSRRITRKRREAKKFSKKSIEMEEKEISQGRLWLQQNWKIMLALFLIFLFGLFLRSYYYYPPATENGFILSGNDPYYHKRVVDYVQENHRHLIFDPLLSYPDGALNPRPPMFDWSVAILGMLFAPLFGGDVTTSTWQVMEFSPAFWGALTAIPVYLIGKEMFNKKAGLICAFLLATMPSHVERSPLGFSDHDAIALFFVVFAFFFFIKALNSLVVREKWVINWLKPKDIFQGFKEWFKYNQISVAFSLLAGLSLASIALIWKGFLYPVVIIIVYFFIQLVLNKLRNKDSLGVSLVTILTLAVCAFLPIPYYNGNNMRYIIEPASEILLAVIIVSAVLVPTRDSPWLLVFSVLAAVLICGFIMLMYVFPEIGAPYFSGQGYFAENKIFSTIAEAQAPDYSRLVFSYGVITTFLALYAILISIIRVAKDLKAHYLFMTIWGITAVYMSISATRFIFNAGPIFAILAGWVVYELIVKLDFRKMMKHYRSLRGGGRFYAVKKSLKVSHVVGVLFLVFLIILPNVWLGWDAGVPFGEKKSVDVAVYDALPFFLKPEEYNYDERGNTDRYPDGVGTMYNKTNMNELKYFGAFGHGFPSDYWLAGMDWLSEQDQDLPIEERPGFISWWDYGFWAIYLGQHPTAADNFQGRVQFAGSFISAKNETQGISLLIARILEADAADSLYKDKKGLEFHEGIRTILIKYVGEENASKIEDVVVHPAKYRKEVLNNPDRYGHWSSDIVDVTLLYAILQTWIPELLSDEERVWLLHELQEETDYSMRYFAIDSRLFPYGPGNTGIFYAPLKLSDHRIDKNNEPYDYLQTIIVASDGREYTTEEFQDAIETNPDLEIREYKLKYYEPFLDSMLLKCYIGYNLDDIGIEDSTVEEVNPNLPAVHASSYIPMQAWMMKHFQLVYRTAYYNPYNNTEYRYHPDAWMAMSEKEAYGLIEKFESDGIDNDRNGKIDSEDGGEGGVISSGLRSGVVFIKYYEGAYLNGTVTTYKGTPIENIRVTVTDEYGIPHDSTKTDKNGEYRLIACGGNVTIQVSAGGWGESESVPYSLLSQRERIPLNSTNLNISDDQIMRREIDEDGDGIWDYYIVQDFQLEENALKGRIYWDNNSNDAYDENTDINVTHGRITVINTDLNIEYSTDIEENGTYIIDDLAPGIYNISIEIDDHVITEDEGVELRTGNIITQDIDIKPGYIQGKVESITQDNLIGKEIQVYDILNEKSIVELIDSDGNYSFGFLLPGNYTIFTNIEGFEDYREDIFLSEGNIIFNNITLFPSSNINGKTFYSDTGIVIENVTIKFQGQDEDEGLTKIARTNNTGFYSIDLRNGKYWVYAKHDIGEVTPYVYNGEIDVRGGDISYDIPLQKSIEVFGYVYRDFNHNGTMEWHETLDESLISFENSNGKWTVYTNTTGFYRAFLPYGNYSVFAIWKTSVDIFIGNLSLMEFESTKYIIEVKIGQRLEGNVYYDLDRDDEVGENEGLAYASLTFTDESGYTAKIKTDSKGGYTINIPTNVSMSVIVKYNGFEDFILPPMNYTNLKSQSDFNLTPLKVNVSGVTQEDGYKVGDVLINFVTIPRSGGENSSIFSNSNGNYSFDLLPGRYNVSVDYITNESSKLVRYRYNGSISMEIGEVSKELNLNLTKYIKVNGTINGTSENVTIHFDALYEEDISKEILSENGTFEIYLVPEEYSVWVFEKILPIGPNLYYVYLDSYNFSESKTIEVNITNGVNVKGNTLYDGESVPHVNILFISNGTLNYTSESDGDIDVYLPENRTYEVVINQTIEDSGETVRYMFSGILDVNTTSIENWNITLEKYIKVSGQTYIDRNNNEKIDISEEMDNITILFESGTDTQMTITNETGTYEVFLMFNETYDITLSADFPILNEGINLTANLTETKKDFSITLTNFTITGQTLVNGLPENFTSLWFWSLSSSAINNTTTCDGNGEYSVELSYGEYTVYARKVSGSDVYLYFNNITIEPRGEHTINLDLDLGFKISGKVYYINSTEQNLSASTKIDFEAGGKVSTFSNEKGQFEIWLPSGKYTVTTKHSTFEFNKTMNYTYESEVEIDLDRPLYLCLNKVKIYSIDLEWIEGTPITLEQNESVTYNVSIKNSGNLEDIFDISVTGEPDWNFTYQDNITLKIDESQTIEVSIQTSPSALVDHDKIEITVQPRSDPETKETVKLDVNIVQVYETPELILVTKGTTAKNNTLIYLLSVNNIGNGNDTFGLNLTGVPAEWNATLSETELPLEPNERKDVTLTLVVPYNTTIKSTTINLTVVSSFNLTAGVDIEVELANLIVEEEDVKVTGDQVSEGALETEPIPGFEALALVAALIVAAIIFRRRDKR